MSYSAFHWSCLTLNNAQLPDKRGQLGRWGQALLQGNKQDKNSLKLCQLRVRLDIGERLFIERVVKDWNRLPSAMMEESSLEVFKICVDVALGDMIKWWP